MLLYDFLGNNELYCCNFDFSQDVNYTYYKNGNKSYIDHIFLSNFASCQMIDCRILSIDYNVSDHLPILSIIKLDKNCKMSVKNNPAKRFPKIDWSNSNLCKQYKQTIELHENYLPSSNINEITNQTEAATHVDEICHKFNSVLHNSAEVSSKQQLSSY